MKTKRNPHKRPGPDKPDPSPDPDAEAFAFALTRTAVAQICKSTGYGSTRESALATLTRVAALFIQNLARSASARSNHSGRTESNLLDLVSAIHDVVAPSTAGILPGDVVRTSSIRLEGGSDGPIADVIRFVEYSKEIPFAKPVPRRRFGSSMTPLGVVGECPRGVPGWLPRVPDTTAFLADKEMGGTGKRQRLWGEEEGDDRVREGSRVVVGGEKKIDGGDLAMERSTRVRFKIGKSINIATRRRGAVGFDRGCESGDKT